MDIIDDATFEGLKFTIVQGTSRAPATLCRVIVSATDGLCVESHVAPHSRIFGFRRCMLGAASVREDMLNVPVGASVTLCLSQSDGGSAKLAVLSRALSHLPSDDHRQVTKGSSLVSGSTADAVLRYASARTHPGHPGGSVTVNRAVGSQGLSSLKSTNRPPATEFEMHALSNLPALAHQLYSRGC